MRKIEEIQPGDWVLARDEFGTHIQLRRVTDTFKRVAFSLVVLDFLDESGGTQTLITTEEHPFWVEYHHHHEFRPASWLKLGDTFTGVILRVKTDFVASASRLGC